MMKRWRVYLEVFASTAVEVEAETEEGARETALDTVEAPFLCYECSQRLELGEVVEVFDTVEVEED